MHWLAYGPTHGGAAVFAIVVLVVVALIIAAVAIAQRSKGR